MKTAYLVLEDGTVFEGESFGAEGEAIGEVVFSTGMVGYQEVLTDPSYAGLMVMMTYPLIGNYGVNSVDNESAKPALAGFIIKEAAFVPNNFRMEGNLEDYLKKNNIITITGIDTRALTRKLRSEGAMNAMITTNPDFANRIDDIKAYKAETKVSELSCKEKYTVGDGKYKVALLDLGVKSSLINTFCEMGACVTVYPAATTAEEILVDKPDGIVISSGPNDPKECTDQIETVKKLLCSGVPMMGVCLGHLIIALAAGAKTYKMKFGHRGANQPVKDLESGRTYITSQNHGYTVCADSVKDDMKVSHININDNSVEGICFDNKPVFTIQFMPDSVKGNHSTRYLLERFITMMGGNK